MRVPQVQHWFVFPLNQNANAIPNLVENGGELRSVAALNDVNRIERCEQRRLLRQLIKPACTNHIAEIR